MAPIQKITITPIAGLPDPFLDGEIFDSSHLPFQVGPGVDLADIHNQMQSADFSLWAREHLSQHEVKELREWRYALVHSYEAEEWLHSDPEVRSRELGQQIFLGLRIVRPSPTPYQYLQARVRSNGSFDPFSFSKAETNLTVPSCDSISPVRRQDAELLKAITPALIEANETDCKPLRRAVRILELGYISEFDVKQLIWVTGLDALFTSSKHWGADVAISRVQHFLGPDRPIYKPADFPSYVLVPDFTVKDVLPDIYKLRNKFAHGEWVPQEFLNRPGYSGKAGESLNYADVLLEATSIIFRAALTKIFGESLLELFCKKEELDKYFAGFGLVRRKKRIRSA